MKNIFFMNIFCFSYLLLHKERLSMSLRKFVRVAACMSLRKFVHVAA